jgi:two-component system chemotaxis sensor kinase CheA
MNDDLLEQFIAEGRELLLEAVEDLLALERAPGDKERINRLFRSIHTVKGSSCLFDIPPLTQVLHAGEDMFQAVRERGAALTPEMVDAMLGALDLAARWVEHLERTETLPAEAAGQATQVATKLRSHFEAAHKPAAAVLAAPVAASITALTAWFDAATLARLAALPGTLHLLAYKPADSCFFKGEDPLYLALQTPGLEAFAWAWRAPWPPLASLDPYQCNLDFMLISSAPAAELAAKFRYVVQDISLTPLPPASLVPASAALTPEVRDLLQSCADMLRVPAPEAEQPGRLAAARAVAVNALTASRRPTATFAAAASIAALTKALDDLLNPKATEKPAAEAAPDAPEAAASGRRMLRVDQEKIDILMNLVGELVVAKNSLPYLAKRAAEQFSARALAREIKDEYSVIDRIAQELQGAVMAVRMMPVGQVFQRFPRLVRDLARKLGKQVDLVITGEATEADKNIIESLFDPLLHMVRNSLDHGIEPPEERELNGKPRTATLTLAARQEGDQAIIEIIDDGRGIDPVFVKRKAFERGLIDDARMHAMDDQEAAMLIFAAGFSTAAQISDVSGRGVGMDVVRAAVETAGGTITLASVLQKGTTLRLSLPLSMAVTRVMTVQLDDRLFGIPMDMVLETVKLPRAAITRIKAAEAFSRRDQIIPLRHLGLMLGLAPAPVQPAEIAVLVVRVGGQLLGLGISAFGEVMEVILKPMDGVLARITGYSGTCLLGDGKVMLVLDLKGLLA